MDEWCSIWFWPADEESLRHVPTPLGFHQPSEQGAAIVHRLANGARFFHWELEFPDVFTSERHGFNAVLGNPPWETVQQESKEFFSDFDPIYRTYGKQAALQRQRELFSSDSHIKVSWEDYCGQFSSLNHWAKSVSARSMYLWPVATREAVVEEGMVNGKVATAFVGESEPSFSMAGRRQNYTYKLFLEAAYALLTQDGRFGFIVPSGLYSDLGTKTLRELFLERSSWEWLFSFENKRKIFDIHGSFKFAIVVVAKTGSVQQR